jgi:endoglucanase
MKLPQIKKIPIPKKLQLVGAILGASSFLVVAGVVALWPTRPVAPPPSPPSHQSQVLSQRTIALRSLWPTPNAELKGTQTLRAAIDESAAGKHDVYWQVNEGAWQKMSGVVASEGSQYQVAGVDVGAWKVPEGQTQHTVTYRAVTTDTNQEVGRVVIGVKTVAAATIPQQATAQKQKAAAPVPSSIPPASAAKATAGLALYVEPNNPAARQATEWRTSRPADAAIMDRLAAQPQARWFGNWNKNVQAEAAQYTAAASAAGKLPVLVLYNIPLRHCNSGGAANYDQYVAWVQKVANGISGNRSLVILEPDALPLISCLSPANAQERYNSLSKAVDILKANAASSVYIDAGHGTWVGADEMAQRLLKSNIARANGFSLNVANFVKTDINVQYGNVLSDKLNGRHFVVDTSRNGLGPAPNNEWCNPGGRAAGPLPTTSVGSPKVDAYLWLKVLGESDGACNGGPAAGQWWGDYALGLMQRAGY